MRSLDERGLCHVQLDDVAVARGDCLAEGQGVRHAVQRSRDALRLALCSEAVGAMEVLLQQTVAYSQTRKQFGRPLSANQVLRHRMVDMAIAVRETRALALRAAILADDATQPELQRRRAVLGATAKATVATRLIAEEAIQLHGAMGVTEELSVGLYVKRLMFCQMVWGPQSQQLRARAEMDAALASGAPEHAPREPEHA
jgi:alkylation response protein AidB-like acyl-CoA dehydrogenase